MYRLERLKKKSLKILTKFNSNISLFNEKNEDFIEYYYQCNFIEKFFIKRNVWLIKSLDLYCGFLWIDSLNYHEHQIRCLYIDKGVNAEAACKYAFNALELKGKFDYCVKDNELNNTFLNSLGFYKNEGTVEMFISIANYRKPPNINDLTLECMKKGSQEKLRCSIQNLIFENDSRVPLSVEDMYFDESQDYFLEDGCFFFKYKNEFIGYGQLIDDCNKALIVNFGIIPEYRGRGLGELFLNHLLYHAASLGYTDIYLKVNSLNIAALELYKKVGFKIINEYSIWEKDK